MLAVQAHENVHAGDWEAAMNTAFTTMKAAVESLTTPFQCGDTQAAAQQRMQSAANAAISDAYSKATDTYNGLGDPNDKTRAAEHAIVDPAVTAIKSQGTTNSWPACQ
jgi:hypothetical protein